MDYLIRGVLISNMKRFQNLGKTKGDFHFSVFLNSEPNAILLEKLSQGYTGECKACHPKWSFGSNVGR